MTMPNDRERTIASIRRWARFLPAQWRAVAEWQIKTERFVSTKVQGPELALDWHAEGCHIPWNDVARAVRGKKRVPPVPQEIADLIAKDAVAPTDADVEQAIRAVNDAKGEVTPQVTPHVDGLDVRKVYVAAEPLPSIEKALEIVHGAREQEYGHPADDLQRIADLWTAHVVGRRHPISRRHPLEPDEVCTMMILLKTARLARSPDHPDSWADIVGYVVCRDRIVNRLGGWLDRAKRWVGGLL